MKKQQKTKPNFSKSHQLYVKRLKKDKFVINFFRVFVLVAFLGIWELLTYYKVLDPFFVSSPSRIFAQIGTMAQNGTLLTHSWVTLYETLIGFGIATAVGYVIAVLLWWNEKVRKVFEPYIVVLNSLPKIALGPVIILWVGAGTSAIVLMCVLICIVITIMSMLSAFLAVEEGKILLMKSMHASKLQILFKLVLPSSMPEFVSVLKINVGMSWVGSIMGEYLTSKAGRGYLIVYGGQIFKIDLVMASTMILCILAFGMYYFVSLLEKKYNPGAKS
ncbi:MAG: ABC transporter permease [Clostridia bacterium]|nr:ABC transporter permease [Clostridia bacterium]